MENDIMEVGNQKPTIHVEVHVKSDSTAKLSDVRIHVLALLNRHSMVFGNFRWTEFDEDFLQKHVESVVLVDLEQKPLDLRMCSLAIHIFTLNEDGPSTLSLEDDEELSAANHWLLPAGKKGVLCSSSSNMQLNQELLRMMGANFRGKKGIWEH